MSSLINTQVKPFKTQAFHNGKFVEVTEEKLKGNGMYLSFTLLILHLFAQLSLAMLRIIMKNYKKWALKYIAYRQILTSRTKHGMMHQKQSKKLSTRC